MELYHVTPVKNIPSILKGGIDPTFSEGRMKVSWFAESEALLWALAHVAQRRKTTMQELCIFECHIERADLTRTRWRFVYNNANLTPVEALKHTRSAAYWIMALEPQSVG